MGCSNHLSISDLLQIFGLNKWHRASNDSRYNAKYWETLDKKTGEKGLGVMMRPVNQEPDPRNLEYPHFTEIYDKDYHKKNFERKGGEVTMWNAHYSYLDDKGKIQHEGAHKTAQAVLDDLDAAINSLKSNR